MSLKAFHFVFIIISLLLGLFLGGYGVRAYMEAGDLQDLFLAGFGLVMSVVLVFYFRHVQKKYKDISYL